METTFKRSKTTDFFYKINLVVYLFGLPNFWVEELKLPKKFIKFYDKFNVFNDGLIYGMIFLEYGAFFTQNNLTQKQKTNLVLFDFSHLMLFFFYIILRHHQKKVKSLVYDLTVRLKKVCNDPEVERQMIRSIITYLTVIVTAHGLAVMMYTVDACYEMVQYNATFTTLVTAYPDVDDKSDLANVSRVLIYIVWWILITRILGVWFILISLGTCLSHQFKNLQNYFIQLSDIFERHDLSHKEKEDKYEAGFKVGIKLHSDTLRCTHITQTVCGVVFSGQIIFNILILVLLMSQMVNSERTLVNLCGTVVTASAVFTSIGLCMFNAGDITVEVIFQASHLATAMYFSGWHHCQRQSSVRLRKLVVIAMAHAQKPVVLKGLGYIELSYESYIKIVKASYSLFSVLF